MTFAGIFLILFLVIGVASLGSRNRDRFDHDNYHQDPYYYFPRNPPPPYYGGYHTPEPYYNPYQAPIPAPYPTMRPDSGGSSFLSGVILLMVTASLLFYLGIKMGVVSAQITLGSPQPTNQMDEPGKRPAPEDAPVVAGVNTVVVR